MKELGRGAFGRVALYSKDSVYYAVKFEHSRALTQTLTKDVVICKHLNKALGVNRFPICINNGLSNKVNFLNYFIMTYFESSLDEVYSKSGESNLGELSAQMVECLEQL